MIFCVSSCFSLSFFLLNYRNKVPIVNRSCWRTILHADQADSSLDEDGMGVGEAFLENVRLHLVCGSVQDPGCGPGV